MIIRRINTAEANIGGKVAETISIISEDIRPVEVRKVEKLG